MQRVDIIQKIGKKYFFPNIENDEFSYKKVLEKVKSNHYKLDLRFEKNNLSVLVETKKNNKFSFSDKDINQLMTYARLEREYRKDNHVVSILYNLENDECRVYYDDKLSDDENLNCMEFYEDKFQKNKINDRNKVLKATAKLNEKLHSFGVKEKLRSQLVGSFLISLNNGLKYHDLETSEILGRIRRILDDKIDNDNCDDQKKIKIKTIIKIFDHEDIKGISSKNLVNLLDLVNEEIIPNIDDRNPHGEDLLNLFFTTFNKYAHKEKNQTFTPPHITDFMCEIVQLNPNSRVLDPTCGSGSFLVQAMYKMLKQVKNDNNKKRSFIKKSQLFGIESSQGPFGLAVTNMLIHRDGKSNIINKSCFDEQLKGWIKNKNIDVVLMNPPFNANIQNLDDKCPKIKKTNMDATKGLYFVYYIADIVQKGYLATILPLPCAIGNGNHIFMYKRKILDNNSLIACFTLPSDLFYPNSSVNTCIMLFKLGLPHRNYDKETFFAYCKDDGFIKRKNQGRIEKDDWEVTKKYWLDAFHNRKTIPGFSVLKKVSYKDEWLAEAYMDTDYSELTEQKFIQTIRDYISYKVKIGKIDDD